MLPVKGQEFDVNALQRDLDRWASRSPARGSTARTNGCSRSRLVLAVLLVGCASAQADFFPLATLSPEPELETFLAESVGKHLAALREPELAAEDRGRPRPPRPTRPLRRAPILKAERHTSSYRYTWSLWPGTLPGSTCDPRRPHPREDLRKELTRSISQSLDHARPRCIDVAPCGSPHRAR